MAVVRGRRNRPGAARVIAGEPRRYQIGFMSDHRPPDRGPERPRSEPEIIPPGARGGPDGGREGVWFRFDDSEGTHRVFVARPGLPSILLGLLLVGFVVALIFLLLAGLVLIWVPVVVAGILFALLSGAFRRRIGQWRAWWSGGR